MLGLFHLMRTCCRDQREGSCDHDFNPNKAKRPRDHRRGGISQESSQVTLRLGLGGVKELRVQRDFCSQVPDDEEVSLLSLWWGYVVSASQ